MGIASLRPLSALALGLALAFGSTARAAPAAKPALEAKPEKAHRVGPSWGESHEVGDDARFEIDARGNVRASRALRLQVTGGAVRDLDVDGVPASAALGEAPAFIGEDGAQWPARISAIEARPGGASAFRLSVLDPRGLRRGLYSITVTYTFDGVREGLVRPGPSSWRFAWTSPPARDGRDSVKVTVVLPRGDALPREIPNPQGAALFRATRHAEQDEMELTRAHVTRGESATWAALLDASAFEGNHRLHRSEEAPVPAAAGQTLEPRVDVLSERDLIVAGLVALAVWALAFVRRGVHRGVVTLGAALTIAGTAAGLWMHAAAAPAAFVLVSALGRFTAARSSGTSRVRVGGWLVLVLAAIALLVHATPWSKSLALVVAAALTSALELVLVFAEWHRDPERRLASLARSLARRRIRVTRESATRMRIRTKFLEGVRAVAIECAGADLVLRVDLAPGAPALSRALATLAGQGSRRVEDGALVVTSALPRWMTRAVVTRMLVRLAERRKTEGAVFRGKDRRLAPARG